MSQLETRVAALEMELAKYNPESEYTQDHSSSQQAMSAAVRSLAQQYPLGPYSSASNAEASSSTTTRTPPAAAASTQAPPAQAAQEVNVKRERLEEDEHDELAIGVGMLSLSGMGDPLYLGASSGVNWARVCAT